MRRTLSTMRALYCGRMELDRWSANYFTAVYDELDNRVIGDIRCRSQRDIG